jgi:beta-lactamase regulating signal transducer with metallopeptidase domain
MGAFWEIIASNAVVAALLAIGTLLLSRLWMNAAAIHVLWIVVLLKLFTPPLVVTKAPIAVTILPAAARADSQEQSVDTPARKAAEPTGHVALTKSSGAVSAGSASRTAWNSVTETAGRKPWPLSTILAAIWICGACGMAVSYAVRIRRFAGLVRDFEPPPPAIGMMVRQLSSRLGLRRVPDVLMTSHTLPPLVWSIGVFPRVILPSGLFARLSSEAQATILAHELVHIRRGDYLVRLLELAANTVFWWHPVVRWASWQLRELEEQCCDARVLELVPHQPRTYAAALVDTLEFLSEQPRTPVPLPTAVHSTGSLSRRIRMLTQNRTNRLSALSAALVAGLVAVPLVITFAADPPPASQPAAKAEQATGASAAILRGRVADEAGAPLADVRVRVAIPAIDMRFMRTDTPHKILETKSDAKGDYRLEIPEIARPTTISIDAMKPGYCRLVGPWMSGPGAKKVEVAPGAATEASLILKPALYFAGRIVDEGGKPIAGVEISAHANSSRSAAGIEFKTDNTDGSFEIFNYPLQPVTFRNEVCKGVVSFFHPDYVEQQIPDVYALAQHEGGALRILLPTGRKLAGTVLDDAGKPVLNAMVKATSHSGKNRKATMTDANGKFTLRGLADGPTTLTARALEIKQKMQQAITVDSDQNDFVVRLKAIGLPAEVKKYTVLGMQLADATPKLQSAYDLFSLSGALILDPGQNSDRLDIGRLAEGYSFFMVGNQRIGSVRDFVKQILAEAAAQKTAVHRVRVVYSFKSLDFDGTNTQYLKLTNDDLKQLEAVLAQFPNDSR